MKITEGNIRFNILIALIVMMIAESSSIRGVGVSG